jgi:O-antigen ligase
MKSLIAANLIPLLITGLSFFLLIFNQIIFSLYAYAAIYHITYPRDVSKLILLLGVFTFLIQAIKERSKLYIPKCFFWIFLFALYCAFGYLVSFLRPKDVLLDWGSFFHSPYFIGITGLIQLSFSIMIMIFVINIIKNKKQLSNVLKIFMFSSTAVCGMTIVVYVLKILGFSGGILSFIKVSTWIVPRLYGTAVEPLAFANQILVTLPFLLVLIATGKGKIIGLNRLVLFIMFCIQSLALLLTFSLGAFFAFAVSIIFIFVFSKKKKELIKVSLLSLVIISIIFIIGINVGNNTKGGVSAQAFEYFLTKIPFLSTSAGIAPDRQSISSAGWSMFQKNPLMGVGLGNLGYSYKYYAPPDGITIDRAVWKANNDWLTLLAETGIVGTAFYFIFLFSIFSRAIKNLFIKVSGMSSDAQQFILGLTISSIAVLAQSLFGYFFQNPYVWLLLGLLIVSIKLFRDEIKNEDNI